MALRDFNKTIVRLPMRVWDLPVRLFHWLLLALVVFSYVSVSLNWMDLHLLSGYCVLTLLLFRVAWGFVGSETARFGSFLKSPAAAFRHLAHFRAPEPDNGIGHNAAGGWMVIAFLIALGLQVGSGLFSNDDGATYGPLTNLVSKPASDRFSIFHGLNFYLVLTLIVLHVAAIAGYAAIKKHDLVRPMLTGKKRLPAATRAPRMASPILAAVVLALAGGAVWALVRFG